MSDIFTPAFIEAELQKAAKATPRPWKRGKAFSLSIMQDGGDGYGIAHCVPIDGGKVVSDLPAGAYDKWSTDADFIVTAANHYEAALSWGAQQQALAEKAEEALISMVRQYCYRSLDTDKEPAVDIYQHDFMSAGEEAFDYLVSRGLARWTDDRHYAIKFERGEE